MSFVTMNGYDVEHASQLLVYENLFPEIQHINGKGVTDKYTKTSDVESVTLIDVMRVLPYAPRFRQLGSANNGAWHNKKNEGGYNNAPQSRHYTIPVDLFYDEGVAITSPQQYSNPVALKEIVMAQLVKSAGMSINVITFAKQIEGFFRNGDNFDKALAHNKGSVVAGDISASEIDNALYFYNSDAVGAAANSPTRAFLRANASLTKGIPQIGAIVVPVDARQGFVSPDFDVLMQAQYMQNASDASARILATGFINPFNDRESKRITTETGLCGMYNGVDLFLLNDATKQFVYIALGILGTADDGTSSSTSGSAAANRYLCRTLLDAIGAIIVYGAGTCRGIVGPTVEANVNTYFGGVYILPKMKVGVEVLHGATIKLVVDGTGSNGAVTKWTAAQVATLVNTLTFTPIDGDVVTGASVIDGFNDGTSN